MYCFWCQYVDTLKGHKNYEQIFNDFINFLILLNC